MSDNDLIRRGDALEAVAGWEIPSTAIADLPAVTVGVKPLVWEAGERDQRRADSILGEFCVTFFGGRWFYQGEPRKGMLDAQAAAQADYEARIMAALDVTPVVTAGVQEVRDQAFREAAGVAGEEAVKVFLRQRPYATTIMREARLQSVAVPVMRLIGTPHPEVAKDDG